MNKPIGYNSEENNITKLISRSSSAPKKISREAIALIKLGETVGQLGESEELLREARHQCHKLRRERNLARKLADSAMLEADRYRGALKKIASMDTSQEASPQQCGAVLIAMNALEKIQ